MKKPGDKLVDKNLNQLNSLEEQALNSGSWGNYEKGAGWTSTFVFTGKVIRLFILSIYNSLQNLITRVSTAETSINTLNTNSIEILEDNDGYISLVLNGHLYELGGNPKDINLQNPIYIFGVSEDFNSAINRPAGSAINKISGYKTLDNYTLLTGLYKIFCVAIPTLYTLSYAYTNSGETWNVGNVEIIKEVQTSDGYKYYKIKFDSAPSTLLKVTFYFN